MEMASYYWVLGAPGDCLMHFKQDGDGTHARVTADFKTEDAAGAAAHGNVEGAALLGARLQVYCTLPEEAERVRRVLRREACQVDVEAGEVSFLMLAPTGLLEQQPPEGASGTMDVIASFGSCLPAATATYAGARFAAACAAG